jgi:hypothetical protein
MSDETNTSDASAAMWMAGRARNLAHRGGLMLGVGSATFAIAFALLLWFTRTERTALLRVPLAIDTLSLARRVVSTSLQRARADSMLADVPVPRRAVARAPLVIARSPAADSVADSTAASGAVVPATASAPAALPDSLRLAVAELTLRLERAQNAPLASSWRALAADPLLQRDVRVRALADSLADAERERNEYDAVGGVDPIYLELSSRVTGYGRAIEQAAVAQRAALLRGLNGGGTVYASGPSAAELARRFAAESVSYAAAVAQRDQAQRLADSALAALARVRVEAQVRDLTHNAVWMHWPHHWPCSPPARRRRWASHCWSRWCSNCGHRDWPVSTRCCTTFRHRSFSVFGAMMRQRLLP